MHKIFADNYESWQDLEVEIEAIVDPLEKGTAFEEFVYFFFLYFSSTYQVQEIFAPVVTGRQFPQHILKKLRLENRDHGVDGVYVTIDGTLVAYQVKFRSGRNVPTARELSTFWAEAEYADYRCIAANCPVLPKVSAKKRNHLSILADSFDSLEPEFFEALAEYYQSQRVLEPEKFEPRDYQKEILDNIESGFQRHDRGKLIAACGIGKTLVSLWAKERLQATNVVFLAPTLTLIRQTLGHWLTHCNEPFQFICVCSDQTVAANIGNDIWDIEIDALDVPVTTDVGLLTRQLIDRPKNMVIFSTYQSLDVLAEAAREAAFDIDLMICDEAHRTAGVRSSELFSLALDDQKIQAERRLFMTATERLVKAGVRKRVEDFGRIVFSMDDEHIYGPVFHRLDFGVAIEQLIISDYRVVIAGTTDEEIAEFVKKNVFLEDPNEEKIYSAQRLFNRILLLKSIRELDLRKVITYHSSVREAKDFAHFIASHLDDGAADTFVGHINGSVSAATRSEIIREFEEAELGVLTNVRCLAEGVDIPLIDAVYFSDPKSSLIDIVQAVGRAVRQKYGERGNISYIIVPFLLDAAAEELDEEFEEFFNVIQSLREQDSSLAEWIDGLNIAAVKGGKPRVGGRSGVLGEKVTAVLPDEIDVNQFLEDITIQIADVNKNPVGTTGIGSKLGKTERVSTFKRVFKTLGDYTPEKYRESLVDPTLAKMQSGAAAFERKTIAINNNNVSHTERLGLIGKNQSKLFEITPIGQMYVDQALTFEQVFQNQMMKYSVATDEGPLFPYRIALETLRHVKIVNYYEFLYGLYSLQPNADEAAVVNTIVERILAIREAFPNLHMTSEANKPDVLEELNRGHPVGFSFNDVWTDRTTTGNQYRYFRRHLELYSDVILSGSNALELTQDGDRVAMQILEDSKDCLSEDAYDNYVWLA
jgi:superfamily II DNA or RNA helicase